MAFPKFVKSRSLPLKSVIINDDFWGKKLDINNNSAIFYQWKKLEETHNQDNFRILAKKKDGYRFGFFFSDSDLHKWVDAASRILTTNKNNQLAKLIHEYIDLMIEVQLPDGYLFTYNQFHFPSRRWANIQIEHEFYCLGHLIEAAVSYMETTESIVYKRKFLSIAKKAADLIVKEFYNAPPKYTPGHPELEIALIRLFRLTQEKKYLDQAVYFLIQRGKIRFFGLKLLLQARDQKKRAKQIKKEMEEKKVINDTNIDFFVGETKHNKETPFLGIRSLFQYLTGRYQQQNSTIYKMKRPYGHSVRWGYLATAIAMIYQETGESELLKILENNWNHLVQKLMFITGGIGSLGTVEGFGRDYELNSEYCYCETCAAISNVLLNWEMALNTNQAHYSDLLEWQLYNAISVGMGLDGTTYLYRNLLVSDGAVKRKPWYVVPCCPSNISRVWSSIGQYIYSYNEKEIWIHQFIGNKAIIQLNKNNIINIHMTSELPWQGSVKVVIEMKKPTKFILNLRIPSWIKSSEIKINNKIQTISNINSNDTITGSGFSPYSSEFYSITRVWEKQTTIELYFPMTITIHRAHIKVKSNKNKIALSRGPIVYCFESIDNPNTNIPNENVDLSKKITEEFDKNLLNGVIKLTATNKQGQELIAIPYYCWANRSSSRMQVWIQEK